MKKIITFSFLILIACSYIQAQTPSTTVATTTIIGSMKITDSLNVTNDIKTSGDMKATGDIKALGEMVAKDTMRAEKDLIVNVEFQTKSAQILKRF